MHNISPSTLDILKIILKKELNRDANLLSERIVASILWQFHHLGISRKINIDEVSLIIAAYKKMLEVDLTITDKKYMNSVSEHAIRALGSIKYPTISKITANSFLLERLKEICKNKKFLTKEVKNILIVLEYINEKKSIPYLKNFLRVLDHTFNSILYALQEEYKTQYIEYRNKTIETIKKIDGTYNPDIRSYLKYYSYWVNNYWTYYFQNLALEGDYDSDINS